MLKNQRGFAVIEAVLAILLVGAIGVGVYFAYKAHHKKASNAPASSSSHGSTASKNAQATTDPYAGWQTATLATENLSFKYPTNWTADTSQNTGAYPTITLKDSTGFTEDINALPPNSTAAQLGGSDGEEPFNAVVTSLTLQSQVVYLIDYLNPSSKKYVGTELSACSTKKCFFQNKVTGDDIEVTIFYNPSGATASGNEPAEFDPSLPAYQTAVAIAKSLSF